MYISVCVSACARMSYCYYYYFFFFFNHLIIFSFFFLYDPSREYLELSYVKERILDIPVINAVNNNNNNNNKHAQAISDYRSGT